MGRMKAVVHRRGDADGQVFAVVPRSVFSAGTEQVLQGVGKAFGLEQLPVFDLAHGAHDAIAGTHQGVGVFVDRASPWAQLANKAVVQAVKALLFGLGQIQIGKLPPYPNGRLGQQRMAQLAEPTHEMRQCHAGNAVGKQKVQVLVGDQVLNMLSNSHHFLTLVTYKRGFRKVIHGYI